MITSIPYSPKISPRLTPTEAIDGSPAVPCHTNSACVVPLFGYALVGDVGEQR